MHRIWMILILFLLVSHTIFAVSYKSLQDGSWTNTTSIWDKSGFPDDTDDQATIDNQDSIRLQSGTYFIGDLTIKNNSTLVIDVGASLTVNSLSASNRANIFILGDLDIVNDVSVGNNDTLLITSSGSMAIGGNFSGGNNVELDVAGSMDVTGDFTLGTGSVISGSPGAITVGGTIDNQGTDLNGVLPVVLNYFKATTTENGVLLEWETLTELNNDYFTVERSANGMDFTEIASVQGHGSTDQAVYYTYLDSNPLNGISYYRLSQTDFDGTTERFRIIALQFQGGVKLDLKLYPNPIAYGDIKFSFDGFNYHEKAILLITDLSGRSVINKEYSRAESLIIDGFPSDNLPKGCYILEITQNDKARKSMLIKQ